MGLDEWCDAAPHHCLRGINHSGLVAFFPHAQQVYVIDTVLSLACTDPSLSLVNPDSYYRLVDSSVVSL